MKILKNLKELNNEIDFTEKKLSFIPTMGGLHKGHLSLIAKAKKKKIKTIVSIYINESQFNDKNDFLKYPRNITKDINILKKSKPDYIFIPNKNIIYKEIRKNKIVLNKFNKYLCGKYRPKHFIGVVDVIDRFLKIIRPKYIYLGEKDYQQFILIKKYICNKYKTKVIMCKTIRDKFGLALSTRNLLLTGKEKKTAASIYRLIKKYKKKINIKYDYLKLKKDLYKKILNLGVDKVEYLEMIDLKNNNKITKKNKQI